MKNQHERNTIIWRRRLFLVRTKDDRLRFGPARRTTDRGESFVGADFGHYRLGWWYRKNA